MLDIKRTWSVATSPRNPYKLSDELILLAEFEGKKWDKKTQGLYAKKLAESEFYEGKIHKKEPGFSARDRINRSPKTFGFARFDDKKRIKITPAGEQLMKKKWLDDLFLRQLLKWQYPSVKHRGERYKGFKIKPFLEILRLVYELGGLSKREIAIFGITLINYKNYEKTKNEIIKFREKIESLKNSNKKKAFVLQAHILKFRKVYREEIKEGLVKLRQQKGKKPSVDDFLKTKIRNSIDYADAAIRYFRATGLFTISARTLRLELLDTKTRIAKIILKTISREPERFEKAPSVFLDFLGDSSLPILPQDDINILIGEVSEIVGKFRKLDAELPKSEESYTKAKLGTLMLNQLRDIKSELEKTLQEFLIDSEIKELRSYRLYPEIIEIFNKIQDWRDPDIPDKPLFFEWNIWRALNMLDDGKIEGNLGLDNEGRPLHTAPPKFPDIICYYRDFVLVVEVTLQRGMKQYEAEGEPVARHLGGVKKALQEKGDKRPVFGLFIAVSINPATIAHFYVLRKTKVEYYGGEAKIIPLDLNSFERMIEKAKQAGGIKARQIYRFVKWADSMADEFDKETEWYNAVTQKTPEWTDVVNSIVSS